MCVSVLSRFLHPSLAGLASPSKPLITFHVNLAIGQQVMNGNGFPGLLTQTTRAERLKGGLGDTPLRYYLTVGGEVADDARSGANSVNLSAPITCERSPAGVLGGGAP